MRLFLNDKVHMFRSSPAEVFLRKGVLKIYSKFTGERPCRSATSIKLQSNFIEVALQDGCSPINLLHIFRPPFPKNTSEGLFLYVLFSLKLASPYLFKTSFFNVLVKKTKKTWLLWLIFQVRSTEMAEVSDM